MKRLAAWALPFVLAVAGISLIIVGTRPPDDQPATSLPPIVAPSASAVARASATVAPTETPAPSASAEPTATPVPTRAPLPAGVTAQQLEIPSVGINVEVRQAPDPATNAFPPRDAAYVLYGSAQPGQHTNSYISAHANEWLFKPLWNVMLGDEVRILMSDGTVLTYIITEIRPNVACPDPDADPALNPPDPPAVLELYDTCDEGVFWLQPTPYERLTLQTSQGYNRNWGEFVVVADPAF